MRVRYKLLTAGIVLAGIFLWGRCGGRTSPPHRPAVLPHDETERITIDPLTHRITIQTPAGIKTETLPDRKSIIDVEKNGSVKLTVAQFGFETRPFIGLGVGQGVRAYAGTDLFFFKKLDIGLGLVSPKLGGQSFNDFRLGLFGSYNIWSNSRLTFGYDTEKTIHVLISVRI